MFIRNFKAVSRLYGIVHLQADLYFEKYGLLYAKELMLLNVNFELFCEYKAYLFMTARKFI